MGSRSAQPQRLRLEGGLCTMANSTGKTGSQPRAKANSFTLLLSSAHHLQFHNWQLPIGLLFSQMASSRLSVTRSLQVLNQKMIGNAEDSGQQTGSWPHGTASMYESEDNLRCCPSPTIFIEMGSLCPSLHMPGPWLPEPGVTGMCLAPVYS